MSTASGADRAERTRVDAMVQARHGTTISRLLEREPIWVKDFERHEALSNRVEVGDLHRWAVAAAWL